jgi:hypothetical protein
VVALGAAAHVRLLVVVVVALFAATCVRFFGARCA